MVATYLVTGGCGFIGSHLCSALRSAGHGVRVLDDLSTGTQANLAPGADLVRGDVGDAGRGSGGHGGRRGLLPLGRDSLGRARHARMAGHAPANLSGTVAVFEAAARLGRIPVVYASSAAVYGDCAALPSPRTRRPGRSPRTAPTSWVASSTPASPASCTESPPGPALLQRFGPRQDPRSPYSGVISIFCERSRGASR